jgi:gas vesicle protein
MPTCGKRFFTLSIWKCMCDESGRTFMVDEAETKGSGTYTHRDVALMGLTTGASIGSLITGAIFVGADRYSDPLRDAMQENKIKNVQPDQLADEIAKDPTKHARWKELREFVAKIDDRIGKNLEQASDGSQEAAKRWKDRAEDSKRDSHGRIPPG